MQEKLLRDLVEEMAGEDTGRIVESGATGAPCLQTLTTGESANTFGAWLQYIASTPADWWLTSCIIYPSSYYMLGIVFEIGVGAAASEVTYVRFSIRFMIQNAQGDMGSNIYTVPIPIKIASGSRIAMRAAVDVANARTFYTSLQFYQSL